MPKGFNNLNPLEPDVHGTGKWNFSGKNLPKNEVEALTKKGVDWTLDIMPDGRLKHPRFRRFRIANRAKALRAVAIISAEGREERWAEYQALPDPKPDYCEWAAQRDRRTHFDAIERIAMHSKRDSDRIKALSTIFEYTKTKPKTISEVLNKVEDAQDVSLEKILEAVILQLGPEVVKQKLEMFKPQ